MVEVAHLIADGRTTKSDIAEFFEFNERQGDYYATAAAYLGLLERKKREFVLSAGGARFVRMASRNERAAHLLECVLKRPIFHELLALLCAKPISSSSMQARKHSNWLTPEISA